MKDMEVSDAVDSHSNDNPISSQSLSSYVVVVRWDIVASVTIFHRPPAGGYGIVVTIRADTIPDAEASYQLFHVFRFTANYGMLVGASLF